jgi:hypothetical protein
LVTIMHTYYSYVHTFDRDKTRCRLTAGKVITHHLSEGKQQAGSIFSRSF